MNGKLTEREPLAIRAAVVAALAAVVHLLVLLGALPLDAGQEAALVAAFDVVALAVMVVWTRGKVTPVADPSLANHVVMPEAEAAKLYEQTNPSIGDPGT